MEIISHTKHAVNVSEPERWASLISGAALAIIGLRKASPGGLALALVGGDMIRRGATGHCLIYEALGVRTAPKGQGAATTSVPYEVGIRVDKSITVNKPKAEVFQFWRNIENLGRFMKHVENVRSLDEKHSHWCVKGPSGRTLQWDAEINNEIENQLIAWRSLPGADVDNAGSVQFKDAPGGLGTEVRVELQYNPPAGILGAFFAKMWGEEPSQQIQEDLRRFKQIMETGEIPTTEGQPKGRGLEERRDGEVHKASEQSFPASDAPAWR